MTKPLYDNLEDARTKLTNTLCYYGDKAINVKEVNLLDEDGNYSICIDRVKTLPTTIVEMSDPNFNCTDYNIGYTNHEGCATWWARRPLRQYRQGLRSDQMAEFASHPGYRQRFKFSYCKPVIDMLENNYPDLEKCQQLMRDKVVMNVAFSKDFAAIWDDIHDDMIIEYRSRKIGMSHKFEAFNLLPEYKYLTETLLEVIHVHG